MFHLIIIIMMTLAITSMAITLKGVVKIPITHKTIPLLTNNEMHLRFKLTLLSDLQDEYFVYCRTYMDDGQNILLLETEVIWDIITKSFIIRIYDKIPYKYQDKQIRVSGESVLSEKNLLSLGSFIEFKVYNDDQGRLSEKTASEFDTYAGRLYYKLDLIEDNRFKHDYGFYVSKMNYLSK